MDYMHDYMYPGQNGAEEIVVGNQWLPHAGMAIFLCVLVWVAIVAFQVWLYYRIFSKGGFNGWMGLLSLIPFIGSLVCLLVLAFDTWPRDRFPQSTPPAPPAPHATVPNTVVPPATTDATQEVVVKTKAAPLVFEKDTDLVPDKVRDTTLQFGGDQEVVQSTFNVDRQ